MFYSLSHLLDSDGFLPHGHCYLWIPALVRLHLLTDLAIGVSYVAISSTLVYLVRRAKSDIPFSWMFVCFGAFIVACGGTHFMEVWTLWTPFYWLSGAVKLVTATASVLTALVLPPLVPKTLALIRSAKQAESVMAELQHEIAERKRHQDEVRELNADLERRVDARTAQLAEANHSLARLAAIVACSNDAIASLDLDSRITTWNPAAERVYGYREAEILGRSVSLLAPAGVSSETPAMIERIKRGERVSSFETTRVRKTGEQFSAHLTLSPIKDETGEILGTSSITRDITERKRVQEEIQRLNQDLERRVIERTEALTASNAELEAFCYSVSHDLRAPLRQIAGFSNILVKEHGSELTPESQRYIRKVMDGAQQMGELIDDLLNLSKIGRRQLARRPASLAPLIDAALEDLKPEVAGREIEWHLEELGSLECDAGLLKQVFANLLSNAIRYTRGRHPAVIQVGQTTIEGERAFFVRDNGAGFDMQYAGKLFGVFQRLHKAQDFEGTGVGLATVQRIIHKHGGRIWAEAELDQGAAFFFTIPESK